MVENCSRLYCKFSGSLNSFKPLGFCRCSLNVSSVIVVSMECLQVWFSGGVGLGLDAFHPASASVFFEGGFILEIFLPWRSLLLGGMEGKRVAG